MNANVKRNFVLQQGFENQPVDGCGRRFTALQFQPRVILVVVVAGVIIQAPYLFLVLGLVLAWNASFPRWNPFDALHNALFARRPGRERLTPAPPPRRFAQTLAALFTLTISGLLLAGLRTAAYVVEGALLAAVGALVFGGFCLGSFLYHVLTGRSEYARGTLPWSREPRP